MISDAIKQAITICIDRYIPFFLYQYPDNDKIVFYSNPSYYKGQWDRTNVDGYFLISFFSPKLSDIVGIKNELDEYDTIALSLNCTSKNLNEYLHPYNKSTDRCCYELQCAELIKRLKLRGGKTVLSKVVCGNSQNKSWSNVVEQYFNQLPHTFRYMYFTPDTGFWFGATPEILLNYVKGSDKFVTMSLAGTRNSQKDNSWDSKNLEEHDLVTNYIVETLSNLGINSNVKPSQNLIFGDIQHLCNIIEGEIGDNNPIEIAKILSPTPALSGYPVKDAMIDIKDLEQHPRLCYGGFVAVVTSKKTDAFVNIRCVHFDKESYCIYGGGGITSKSNIAMEWDETEKKIKIIKNILS